MADWLLFYYYSCFSLVVGLAVRQAIAASMKRYDASLQVKWPNDIVIDDRKIGGVLTEASIDCENVKSLVIGIGINCNSTRSDFPSPLTDTISSLKEISGRQISINEINGVVFYFKVDNRFLKKLIIQRKI